MSYKQRSGQNSTSQVTNVSRTYTHKSSGELPVCIFNVLVQCGVKLSFQYSPSPSYRLPSERNLRWTFVPPLTRIFAVAWERGMTHLKSLNRQEVRGVSETLRPPEVLAFGWFGFESEGGLRWGVMMYFAIISCLFLERQSSVNFNSFTFQYRISVFLSSFLSLAITPFNPQLLSTSKQ